MHFVRDGGRSERENFGEEDEGALTKEDIPKLQRREIGDFGRGTPYNNNNNPVQQHVSLGTVPSHRFFLVIFGCFDFAIEGLI